MRPWLLPALAVAAILGALLHAEPRPAIILDWYLALRRPWWQPPDWAIPLVWGVIYLLIGVAILRAWRAARAEDGRGQVLVSSTVNLFLNFLWPVLFFAYRRPDWALAEVGLLWLSILWMIWALGRQDRVAGWLLLPYLLWVGFAARLNLALVGLNAPFP